jgi:hypothetical protein
MKSNPYVLGEVMCYPHHDHMTWKTTFSLFLFGSLFLIVIAATISDLYAHRKGKFGKRSSVESQEGKMLLTMPININGAPTSRVVQTLASDTQHCGCETDRDHFKRAASIGQLFRCFSAKRSWELLTSQRKECSRGLRVFDGIRVLSILWVITGQTWSIQARLYPNTLFMIDAVEQSSWHVIIMGTLAPDTFLFMGGFLASYRVLHVYAFEGHAPSGLRAIKATCKLILRRYFRLTPLLALVLSFYYFALPTLIGGPIWNQWLNHPEYADCQKSWWTVLVYGNNLVDTQCMGWTWYTAVDFQLFVMVPFVTLAFWHFGIIALGVVVVLMFSSVGINAWEVSQLDDECSANLLNVTDADAFGTLEMKPWIRAVPYLLGITLSFLYNAMGEFEGARNFRGKIVTKAAVWCVAAVLLALPVFANINEIVQIPSEGVQCRWSHKKTAAYLSFARLSWSLGIFVLVGTCLVGWGDFIGKLLSARSWAPFSRLVYGVFLVHPILIEIRAFGNNNYVAFTEIEYVLEVAGFILLSFVVSACFYMLIEGPLYQIRQLLR